MISKRKSEFILDSPVSSWCLGLSTAWRFRAATRRAMRQEGVSSHLHPRAQRAQGCRREQLMLCRSNGPAPRRRAPASRSLPTWLCNQAQLTHLWKSEKKKTS